MTESSPVLDDSDSSRWSYGSYNAPPRRRASWWRWLAWLASSAAICAAYVFWRAPQPMLELKHIEHLGRDTQQVAISFDDAPHPVITPLLLASLKYSGVKASFFVIGDGLGRYPELTRRLLLEGHALANHSENHHNLSTIERSAFDEEVLKCFSGIESAHRLANVPGQTRLFRPPGGGMDRDVMQFLWRNKVTLAWWSNNVGDWARPPSWKIFDGVRAHLRPGDIILLHEAPGGYGTPQAIPGIVRIAKSQGLECVLMPEK